MLTKVKREVSNELEFLSLKSNNVVRSVKGTFLNHVPVNKGGMCLTAADAGHILLFFKLYKFHQPCLSKRIVPMLKGSSLLSVES